MSRYLTETFSSGSYIVGKTADVGGTWAAMNSAWGTSDANIVTGSVVIGNDGVYFYKNSQAPGSVNQTPTLEFTPTADNWIAVVVIRAQSDDSAYMVVVSAGTTAIYTKGAGAGWINATLATTTNSLAAGNRSSNTLVGSISGSTLTVTLNSVAVDFGSAVTDTSITAAGLTGFAGRSITASYVYGDNDVASAAVLSSPSGSATGPTHGTISVTSDTAPTTTAISYQILPAATAAPSAATIVGTPDGTISTGSIGALTKAITGLTTNTAVKVHFAQGTTSNVVSSGSFTPHTLAISGSPSAQTGSVGAGITWTGATPQSLLTDAGNGAGAWSIVSTAGFTSTPSINPATGVLSGGVLGPSGAAAPQIKYTDSSTVPTAQSVTLTLGLTVSPSGDVTVPTLTSAITVTAITPTGYSYSHAAGADNVLVTTYERSLDGGATWADDGNVLSGTVSGRTPGSVDALRIRAKDAAGNVSTPALAVSVPLDVYKCRIIDWVLPTATQHAPGELWNISFHHISTRALVANLPGTALVTGVDGLGSPCQNLVGGSAAFALGTQYTWVATHPTNATWFACGVVTATL